MGASMGDEPLVVGGEGCMDLPPGFRFYPTDEEIITHYLFPKIVNCRFTARAIGEADLNKSEPWELPSMAKMGEKELYFFCHRDRKYPTGMRTNRATEAGYWKATGKDKEIYRGKDALVGMKKTLVFYRGRAPKGSKTNWVMHEYRLESKVSHWKLPKSAKDDWVVCRIFEKTTGIKRGPSNQISSNQEDGFNMEASQSPMNSHDGLNDLWGGGPNHGSMSRDYSFINNQIMSPYHMKQNPCLYHPQSFTNLAFTSQNRTGAIECKIEGCPTQLSQMGITTIDVPMSDDMDLKTMWDNPIQ